jgi:CheY-like chemotaxis protein
MDMNDASTRASRDYHYHYNNKYKSLSGLGSHDPKYYDEIITKLNLQTREQQHERNSSSSSSSMQQLLQDQTASCGDKKKRVLLVDDEPDSCMTFQAVLEDAGFKCISYTDSLRALQEFRSNYYDLILLDIRMPTLNGFELCKKIREVDKTLQVVFITASEAYYEQPRRQSYPELINDVNINYVQKPIANQELIRLVNMLLATNHHTK